MWRRLLLLGACAGLILGFFLHRNPPPRGPADLILITLDTTRADRISAYGYFRDTTPNIDAFAEEAVLFSNARSPIATTLPAHISMMTGTNPLTHGVLGNLAYFRKGLDRTGPSTLAELLQAQGYATGAFVSSVPLRGATGMGRGFDRMDAPVAKRIKPKKPLIRGERALLGQRPGAETLTLALQWLDKQESPVFLWVHFFEPHLPYLPSEEMKERFQTDDRLNAYLDSIGLEEAGRKVRRINGAYDAEIADMDALVGRLLDALKERGIYQDAVLVIAGDHGEGLGQHHWLQHGHIHEEQLLVPLLMRIPGVGGGRVVKDPVSLEDLLPTLAANAPLPLAQVDPKTLDGRNALKLHGESRVLMAVKTTRIQHNAPVKVPGEEAKDGTPSSKRGKTPFLVRQWDPSQRFAAIEGQWKYVYRPETADELYNLREDPYEQVNVAQEQPERSRSMSRAIQQALEKARKRGVLRPDQEDNTDPTPEPEMMEQLRALGYVE